MCLAAAMLQRFWVNAAEQPAVSPPNPFPFWRRVAGKVPAIRACSRASGIPLADFVAFGGDVNDLEILRLGGTGVAVANAVPEGRL